MKLWIFWGGKKLWIWQQVVINEMRTIRGSQNEEPWHEEHNWYHREQEKQWIFWNKFERIYISLNHCHNFSSHNSKSLIQHFCENLTENAHNQTQIYLQVYSKNTPTLNVLRVIPSYINNIMQLYWKPIWHKNKG
jgi:hypothetical protein